MCAVDYLPSYISSPRLTLRHWESTDAGAACAAVADSLDHLRPWMAWAAEEPPDDEDFLDMVAHWHREWKEGRGSVFGVFRDDVIVGGAGLHRRGGDAVEIGCWVHVDHLRRGYAAETAQALTDAAFLLPEVARVEIHHDKANSRSEGIPIHLGFSLLDETPDDVVALGEIGIDCRWVMYRRIWRKSHSPRP